MDHSGQKELNTTLDYLEKLANEDHGKMKKHVYEVFSGISFLILEAKKAKFKKGWVQKLVDRHDDPLFDKSESTIIENAAQAFIKPIFTEIQKGGVNIKQPSASSIIKPITPPSMEDLSLDRTFWKIRDMFKSIDTQVKKFSKELGPFRFFYDKDMPDFRMPLPVPIPAPPFVTVIMVPINPRAIPIIIGLVVEAIRITYSVGPLSNDNTRKILSLVLGIIDILKGDWKQGLLSMIGFFGQTPMLAGLITKVMLNILDFVAPDLQERLVVDLYQSGKSMSIGFLLWGFANFAPDVARASARIQFDAIKKIVDDGNGKIHELEAGIQKSLEPAGLTIKMKNIPEDFVPTFDDIQNIQAIVRQPSIFCSKEFQEAIEPLKKLPPIRLILELMSIPTDPQTLAFECKDHAGESIEETVETLVTPEITPDPDSPIGKVLTENPGIKHGGKRTANRRWRRSVTRRKH